MISVYRDAAPEKFFENIVDGNALARAGIQMLDKLHVDFAGEEGELDRAQFVEGPTLSAATGGDRFTPDRRDFFTERLLLDLQQAGKEFRDFFNAARFWLGRCHVIISSSADISEAWSRFSRLFFALPNQASPFLH